MRIQHISFWLYRIGVLAIVVGMPLGKFFITAGIAVLALAWLTEGEFRLKFKKFGQEKILWVITAFILLHVLGLGWSDDIPYGLKDIKTKLPLLIVPFVLITSTNMNWNLRWKEISWTFLISVLVLTVISTGIYLGIIPTKRSLDDIRNIIPTVSHVRLSLFICLSVTILVYRFFHIKNNLRFVLWLPVIWFCFFLNLIESATGIIILLALILLGAAFFVLQLKSIWQKAAVAVCMLLMMIIPMYWVNSYVQEYYEVKQKIDISKLPAFSPDGEKYLHDSDNPMVENGHYVWLFIAYDELETSWNQRSKILFDSLDKKGQPLRFTLIRYLSSKGLHKDNQGVKALTSQDIQNIENGIANVNYTQTSGLKRRIQQLIFEWESFRNGSLAFGNSVTQRLLFWKLGWNIFQSNFWFGVGTGDVQKAFDKKYNAFKYKPDKKFALRAHNLYLTMALTFGIIGFFIFIIYAFSLLIFLWRKIYFISAAFLLISLISFVSEDTLETQAGVTFFAFFHGLFYVLNRNGSDIS